MPWRIFSDTTIGPLLNFFKMSALALNSTFEFLRVERRPLYHQCREATTRTPGSCFHKLASCSLISRTSSGQSGWTGPPASTLWRRPRAGQVYLYIEWSDATVTIRSLCCAATRRIYCAKLSGDDLSPKFSRYSNKIESVGLRQYLYYSYLTKKVTSQ